MTPDVLPDRALNRATLARQLLLRRSNMTVPQAVTHLIGLQSQLPQNPYIGLFARLQRFRPETVSTLLTSRQLVRIVVMRATIHLVTADDCVLLRPLMQPVLDAEIARHSEFAPHLVGVDLAPVLDLARALVQERPLTGPQLRVALEARFPGKDAAALAYACRCHLPMAQVPPRGLWRTGGAVTTTTADHWLGRPLDAAPSIDAVMLRYFAAFGPASVADVAAWCRLAGLGEIVERLGAELRPFRSSTGRALFDLPDADRPDPETPAPVRFLPEYDNLLLSHANRSRFQRPDVRMPEAADRIVRGTVLHDGFVVATWHLAEGRTEHVLHIDPLVALRAQERTSIEREGTSVLRFATDRRGHGEVRVANS